MQLYHGCSVVDLSIPNNNPFFVYETPHKVPYTTTQVWTKGMATLRMLEKMDIVRVHGLDSYHT